MPFANSFSVKLTDLKKKTMCASCLLNQQDFPFVNTTIMDVSSSENSACINDNIVGETMELMHLRQLDKRILVTYS